MRPGRLVRRLIGLAAATSTVVTFPLTWNPGMNVPGQDQPDDEYAACPSCGSQAAQRVGLPPLPFWCPDCGHLFQRALCWCGRGFAASRNITWGCVLCRKEYVSRLSPFCRQLARRQADDWYRCRSKTGCEPFTVERPCKCGDCPGQGFAAWRHTENVMVCELYGTQYPRR
jgi:hypothetical protein